MDGARQSRDRDVPGSGRSPAVDRSVQEAQRRHRALEEPFDIRPRTDLPFAAVEVRNPIRQTHYLVLLPAAPSQESAMCVCIDFARRGLGTCKHLEATRLWLTEHPGPLPVAPDPDPSPVWVEVDARQAVRVGGVDGPDLRRVGSVLYRER
ncbi:MAG: hypothetical protein ACREDK_01685 [Thermoplasmata archaeon]